MTLKIGGNVNTNTESSEFTVSINQTTATKVLDALADLDNPRLKLMVHNKARRPAWVRLRAAASDNNKTGISVGPNESKIIYNGESVYRGEVSAILDSGPNDEIVVTVI